MYQDARSGLFLDMTYTEKFSRIAAQHAYEAQIIREGVAAALAPYRVQIPAQRGSEDGAGAAS